MADERKQLTREEVLAKQREFARTTLESKVYQNILGSNQVKSNPFLYGQLGVQGAEDTYGQAMGSEEARKARDSAYKKAKEKGDHLHIFGEPSIGNYEVSAEIIEQLEENKLRLSLGDFEQIVRGISPNVEGIPEELKGYVSGDLYMRVIQAQNAGKDIKDALNERETDAFNAYQMLSEAYNRGVALRSAQQGYFADINGALKKISEKYKPKEKKE